MRLKKTDVKRLIIGLIVCLTGINCYAQHTVSTNSGEIRGVIVDAAYSLKLPAATVSVYTQDSVLVQFTLTNNLGAFTLKSIPLHQPLRLYASFTGYKITTKTFTLDSLHLVNDFKSINMTRDTLTLQTVVVKSIVPVKMNGDTLEFNADAFKLEKNAVVEDLLRRIPAVTIWGDGTITVNGKKISNVYVDGKPFFGGDPKIAMQNLDKSSVSKIQVYNEPVKNAFADTLKNMNIVLKQDRKTGNFGKAGIGKSISSNLYDVDLALNRYSPRSQVGIAGNHNTVNKNVNNLNQIFLNSTYKGNTSSDYATDFSILGENKSTAAGFTMRQDLSGSNSSGRTHQINGEYFYNRTRTDILSSEQQTYNFRPDSIQQTAQSEFLKSTPENHQFSLLYQDKKENKGFDISLNASNVRNTQFRDQHSVTSRDDVEVFKRSDRSEEYSITNSVSVKTGYDTRNAASLKAYKGLNVGLSYGYVEQDNHGTRMSEVSALETTSAGLYFNRKNKGKTIKNSLGVIIESDDIAPLIFGRRFSNTGIKLAAGNEVNYTVGRIMADVQQFDTLKYQYVINEYLTNMRHFSILEETPFLTLSKGFIKKSANRYFKILNFQLKVPLAMRYDQSRSEKYFQNYSLSYVNLLPALVVYYRNNRIGKHQQNVNFDISHSMAYPEMNMVAPLVDSAYDIVYMGNPTLKAGKTRVFRLGYVNKWKDFEFSATASIDESMDALTTNTTYAAFNRRFLTYMNALNTNRAEKIELRVRNSYKLNANNQIQVSITTKNSKYQAVNYFNNNENMAEGYYSSNTISVDYTYKTLLKLSGSQFFNYHFLKYAYLKNDFNTAAWISFVNLEVTPVSHIVLRTDLRYNVQRVTDVVSPYTIWNAAAGCRLLDGRNLELKFSAMDLLRQNKSIRSSINDLSVNLISTNMLQQYYMVSVAYYPRNLMKRKQIKSPI